MHIRLDDLSGSEVIELLQEHRRQMFLHSPPESVHALDVASLKAAEVTFWSAWIDGKLAGCGALKELDSQHGEIKSMRTAPEFLRQKVAFSLCETILIEARSRGYRRLSLETGTMQAFAPARAMYRTLGFTECPPFADYFEDDNSVCMTLRL